MKAHLKKIVPREPPLRDAFLRGALVATLALLVFGGLGYAAYKQYTHPATFYPGYTQRAIQFNSTLRMTFDVPQNFTGRVASQEPRDRFAWMPNGAQNSSGYLEVTEQDAQQPYFEIALPWVDTPAYMDIRNSSIRFWLRQKEAYNPHGARPYLFVASALHDNRSSTWVRRTPLNISEKWAPEDIEIRTNQSNWVSLNATQSLEDVLSGAGFLGVVYLVPDDFYAPADYSGKIDIDELRMRPYPYDPGLVQFQTKNG